MERNISRRHLSIRFKGDESAGNPDTESTVASRKAAEAGARYLAVASKVLAVAAIIAGIVVLLVVLIPGGKEGSGDRDMTVNPASGLSRTTGALSAPPTDLTSYQRAVNMAMNFYNARVSKKSPADHHAPWQADNVPGSQDRAGGNVGMVRAFDADPLADFTVPQLRVDEVTIGNFINSNGVDNFQNYKPDRFTATIINKDAFNILGDQGLSWAVLNYAPGTQNTPHEHPRATEILFVVRGELVVGIADTRSMAMGGPRFFNTTIYAGQLVVFPLGLAHFQINQSPKPVLALAALNSPNPGTVRIEDVLKAFYPTLDSSSMP